MYTCKVRLRNIYIDQIANDVSPPNNTVRVDHRASGSIPPTKEKMNVALAKLRCMFAGALTPDTSRALYSVAILSR